jgi:hypothetical protein
MKNNLFFQSLAVLFLMLFAAGYSNTASAQNCFGTPNAGVAVASPNSHTCSGTSNLTLQGSTVAQGLMYQWEYSTDGFNWFLLGGMQAMPMASTGLITQTTFYRCMVLCTNSGMSSTSMQGTVTITPGTQVTPIATVTPSTGTTACEDEAITFTSTITNGGSTPVYQWQVNGVNVGTNSNTYVAAAGSLSTNDNVSLTVTSSDPCAVPQTGLASVTMTILPITSPTISIQATQTSICQGVAVTFTAIDNAPGGTYQWYVNGNATGPNANSYTYYPYMGDVISLDFTPPLAGCYDNVTVTSNSIPMDVTPGLPTLATIQAQPVATENSNVTVYANLFNFTLNYSIDWFINSVFYTTTTVPYITYVKGPGTDLIFAVANNSGTGCYLSDTTNEISINSIPTTSVNNAAIEGHVYVYPNPSTGSVKVMGLADGDQLQLMNVLGQTVLSKEIKGTLAEEILEMNDLPTGSYILNVHSNDGSFRDMIRLSKN